MSTKMTAVSPPRADLYGFLEIVLMWHCHGNIPMTRISTCEFIEDSHFPEFLQSVLYWCKEFGLELPTRSDVVKTLHQLYEP
jgi:hypothetical protein